MEDGEIDDDSSDEGYVVISRPEVPLPVEPQHQQINIYSDNSSENEVDIDTDSSDSHAFQTKRPKVKMEKSKIVPVPATLNPLTANPKKKWDIWSAPLQEEVLTETLNFGVDLDSDKMDRSVESYNYKLGFLYNKNKERESRSSSRLSGSISDDYIEEKFDKKNLGSKRKSVKERLGRRKKSDKLIHSLEKLTVTADCNPFVVARNIADGLREEKDILISKVVHIFGTKRSIELYNQTRDIEADGGMMVMDQSRRRTPGGVFLKLVANEDNISKDKIKTIFEDEHKAQFIRRKKLIAKKRKKKTKAVKEALITNGLLNNDLSDMLIKTDIKEEDVKPDFLGDNSYVIKTELREEMNEHLADEQTLTNPPPSPATDQDTPPPPREQTFLTYGDDESDGDCLEIETEMDLL